MSLLKYTLKQAKRIVVFVFGMTVLLTGIALIFLPGPALLVIPLGLLILSTEFIWAKRYLRKIRKLATFTQNLRFEIQTEHFLIKPLNETDYPKIQFMRLDPNMQRFWNVFEDFFHHLLEHQKKHGFSIGAVYDTSEMIVGCVGLIYVNLDDTQDEIEVVASTFKDQEEAIKGCINWGFRFLHLDRIVGFSNTEDIGAMLERLGFQFDSECLIHEEVYIKYQMENNYTIY